MLVAVNIGGSKSAAIRSAANLNSGFIEMVGLAAIIPPFINFILSKESLKIAVHIGKMLQLIKLHIDLTLCYCYAFKYFWLLQHPAARYLMTSPHCHFLTPDATTTTE